MSSAGSKGSPNKIAKVWSAFKHTLKDKIFGFDPFSLEDFVKWAGSWGVSRALVLGIMYLALWNILALEIPNLNFFALAWVAGTAPVWAPIILMLGAWTIWVWYLQSLFLAGRDPILLEMKIPRDIYKSPRAMEVALTNMWLGSGEATFYHRAWKGQVRPYFAFEIASFGGEIHFYIWTWKAYRDIVEASIYGQYPEVELYQVEDYASKFVWDPEKYKCFATDWNISTSENYGHYGKGDFPGADVAPIKTYIDFELDKDPKEEFKIEPLSTVLELIGSLRPDEQIWMQFVVRRCGKYGVLVTNDREKEWRKAAQTQVEKLRARASIISSKSLEAVYEELHEKKEDIGRQPMPRPSWQQTKTIEAIERNLEKLPFEFIGHGVYITTGSMRGSIFGALRSVWKPFSGQPTLADISPTRWHNTFDYPWQDFNGFRNRLASRRFFDVYRRRGGFHTPWRFTTNVVTNESLATVWHPPSRTVAVPGLQRIPAQKAAAPSNLPTR